MSPRGSLANQPFGGPGVTLTRSAGAGTSAGGKVESSRRRLVHGASHTLPQGGGEEEDVEEAEPGRALVSFICDAILHINIVQDSRRVLDQFEVGMHTEEECLWRRRA